VSKNTVKTKRAAADPERQGRECPAEPGVFRPDLLRLMVLAAVVTGVAACEGGLSKCPESVASAPATSTKCPAGQNLARVCAPEPDGPCGLYCVAPIENKAP
jgi:hypothetical protein